MPSIKERIPDLLQLKTHPDISNILDGISEFVKSEGRDVSTHQVRRIYNEVKKADNRIALHLLRPKIVYTIARGKDKDKEERFLSFLEKVLKEVKTDAQVEDYVTFMESVVAYHKFHFNK